MSASVASGGPAPDHVVDAKRDRLVIFASTLGTVRDPAVGCAEVSTEIAGSCTAPESPS